jgi:hypothetical protein
MFDEIYKEQLPRDCFLTGKRPKETHCALHQVQESEVLKSLLILPILFGGSVPHTYMYEEAQN